MGRKATGVTTIESLPSTADAIILGGGPAGAAAAWALHRAEPSLRVVLIERADHLGAGSTAASLECWRTCWPTACIARQMARSVEVFQHADEYLGEGAAAGISLKQHGYLFCAFTEPHAETLHRDVAHLHGMGLTHIEFLNADEVSHRFGWLGDRVIAAKFDPVAGWLDSNALIHWYLKASPSVQVALGVGESAIETRAGRVTGVRTPQGVISTPRVLIAAGAESWALGRTAGVELPVVARPRQSFTTSWRHAGFPSDSPLVIGGPPFPHVRPEAGSGAIFGWEYAWRNKRRSVDFGSESRTRGLSPLSISDGPPDALIEPVYPVDSLKDPRFPSLTLALLARQFGHRAGEGFASPRYLQGVHHNIGYYVSRGPAAACRVGADGSPQPYESERAIIDRVGEVEGLFVSIAHVGHGIMTSPAAGEIAASLMLGRPLPDPAYADFGMGVQWVEHDESVL